MNPLRTQNNIQGASDMGALPDMLPGYQPVVDEAARQIFRQAWGVELPTDPGMRAIDMISAAGQGSLKTLYILGEDILNTSPEGAHVRRSLEAAEFIVLQEIMSSETSRYADVLLPGVSFAEKTGTFTSSERRIQMIHEAIQPVGQARPDWQIITELARRILTNGKRRPEQAAYADWDYAGTAEIMLEIAALTPIYAGLTHQRVASGERVQWPVDISDGAGTPLLHTGLFSAGRVQWLPAEQIPIDLQAEQPPVLALVYCFSG
jgi:predicted molibdopterin-dependent oxidoreductase YjgC